MWSCWRASPASPRPTWTANHWVEDGQWYHRDDDGTVTSIVDVLERCWKAAMAVRSWLNKEKRIKSYVVAVAVFPTMEPDDSILAAAASLSTRVQFGMADHVERLAALPGEQDLQHPLQGRYIPDDAEALSRQPAATAAEPETASLDIGDDRVVIHAERRPLPRPPHHRGRAQRRRQRRRQRRGCVLTVIVQDR